MLKTYFFPCLVSPTKDGVFLECCGAPVEQDCSKNPECARLGLDGMCCATVDGVFLDCCTSVPNTCQQPKSCDIAPSETSCELNQQCDAQGLTGVCWYVATKLSHFKDVVAARRWSNLFVFLLIMQSHRRKCHVSLLRWPGCRIMRFKSSVPCAWTERELLSNH